MATNVEADKMTDNEEKEDVGGESDVKQEPTSTEVDNTNSEDEKTADVNSSSDILAAINGLKTEILSLRDIVSIFVDAGAVVSEKDSEVDDGDSDEDDSDGDYIPIDNMDLNL